MTGQIENMFELNVDIAEYYCSTLQQIVVELEDDFDCGALEAMTNPDIDDIRCAVMEVAFNDDYGYYGNNSPVVEGQFGLDYQVINEVYEYHCNYDYGDAEDLFPMSRESVYNKYAYYYANQHMMADIPFDSSKKILMLESLILSIYEENENKKTIKNFAERISIKSLINTKFGNGLVSDLIFTHYDIE